jgi:D-tyrosyl-tRNA(Tyr) deacylase
MNEGRRQGMLSGKKVVYFICTSDEFQGLVSRDVWAILEEKGILAPAGFEFADMAVMKHVDERDNEYYFVPTDVPLCWRYPKYLPEMNKYFADFDFSGMVTWHEGENAPPKVLTVHTLGDVETGVYDPASPQYVRNLMHAIDAERVRLGLDDFRTVTEATHWSGSFETNTPPPTLLDFPVPMVDIEVGSEDESWHNRKAAEALAGGLTGVFDGDGLRLRNLLCVGGMHFDPTYAEAVFAEWDGQGFGISHIIANQWLVSGKYDEEHGLEYMERAVAAIDGDIEAIAFHDKLKGTYKDTVRKLGEKLGVPILKHQRLRKPETIEW